MIRNDMLARVSGRREPWDLIVIGGGATGVGIAVDAATRGFDVLLLEQHDFGKGTSSRSTKLVHGGVRYLKQGNLTLVREALEERGILLRNAPHLVHERAFLIPSYRWWERPYYSMGLAAYGLLAGKLGIGLSVSVSKAEALRQLPGLKTEGLRGGVFYYDGQFDDARLLIHLAMSAVDHGAVLLNYAPVIDFVQHSSGSIDGVIFRDSESGQEYTTRGTAIVNATGVFCDAVRKLADPGASPIVRPSQGIHLVFDRRFLPGKAALMVPKTRDGRVLFAIPWHDHVVVGTTDTPIEEPSLEPQPQEAEIEFILTTLADYMAQPPTRADVLSVFTGIRPLVRPKESHKRTSAVSRDHHIQVDATKLITITGGKWTTYRQMAQDCVDRAIALTKLEDRDCRTHELRVHGYLPEPDRDDPLSLYGTDAQLIRSLLTQNPVLGERLHPRLPMIAAQVVFAARHEMARSIEDVLARRTRMLFLDAAAAIEAAPRVAALMAHEFGRDDQWVQSQVAAFQSVARGYILSA
jgi:glycerol-3-phosphate dehydrogenase